MIWFGSSAGVALSNMYPEIRDTGNYLRKGWHVSVSYLLGFIVMIAMVGWHPHQLHKPLKDQGARPGNYSDK